MLVSFKWLNDYVDVADIPVAVVAEKLTMAGLEVEGIASKAPTFSRVVVARIEAVSPHPRADKLSCCRVFDGERFRDVVCGASNVVVGAVVPFARVGAVLSDGYQIKSSVIRGVSSDGMLCSEAELSIGADNSGVMILPDDLPLGKELHEVLALGDSVLNISITPNRADCYSIVGIAREAAVLFGRDLKNPHYELPQEGDDICSLISVTIEAPQLCPRYSAMMIENVAVGQSPLWMRQRLEAVGIRAISNVVDVTNFVMMEMGQPLHAFDYDFLDGGKVIVRPAHKGEVFVSLDGKERELGEGTLLICDGAKPVAIAGIMGGYNSEVRPETKTVFLESAYFSPVSIRKSSRSLGMGTDASLRFEKGIDPHGVVEALRRAAFLIAKTSGGVVRSGHIDEYLRKVEIPKGIRLREEKIRSLLGITLERAEVARILSSLGMQCEETAEGFSVVPPSYRLDISREADLIEEVIRIHGYEKVPATFPAFEAKVALPSSSASVGNVVRDVFTGYGYSQIITYSFVSPKVADLLGLSPTDERRNLVVLQNPLVEEHGVMRSCLVYSVLQAMKGNVNAGNTDLKLFEIGRVFFAGSAGELPREGNHFCALICGAAFGLNWHFGKSSAGYYDLKGAMEGVFAALRLSDVSWRAEAHEPFLHPYRAAGIFVGETKIGFIGDLHPEIAAKLGLNIVPAVVECDLDALVGLSPDKVGEFGGVSRFPASCRDVAFLLDESVSFAEVEKHIKNAGEQLLESIAVFDVFRGQGVPDGKKSVAFRFSYRSGERTLTEEEVNEAHGSVVRVVMQRTGAKIRGDENGQAGGCS